MNSLPFIHTPLRCFSSLTKPEGKATPKRFQNGSRGFTLIEMMVVVIIITIMASIAVPGVSRQMQSHRARQAAESISMIYRGARLRAMGRGSAVLVRFTGSTNTFQTLEAIVDGSDGTTDGCAQMPESSCVTNPDRWGGNNQQELKSISFGTDEFALSPSDGVTDLDLCFSPSGRSYVRSSTDDTLGAMNSPVSFDLSRTDGIGLKRGVVITSSGSAKTVAYE